MNKLNIQYTDFKNSEEIVDYFVTAVGNIQQDLVRSNWSDNYKLIVIPISLQTLRKDIRRLMPSWYKEKVIEEYKKNIPIDTNNL